MWGRHQYHGPDAIFEHVNFNVILRIIPTEYKRSWLGVADVVWGVAS